MGPGYWRLDLPPAEFPDGRIIITEGQVLTKIMLFCSDKCVRKFIADKTEQKILRGKQLESALRKQRRLRRDQS